MSGVEGSENRKGTARQVRNIFLKKKSWKEPEETKKRWKERTRTKIIQNVSEDRRKEPFFVIDGGIFKSSELKESWVNLSSATFFFDLFFFRFAAFFFFFFSLFFIWDKTIITKHGVVAPGGAWRWRSKMRYVEEREEFVKSNSPWRSRTGTVNLDHQAG